MQLVAFFSFIFIFIPLNPLKWVWERSEKQQISYSGLDDLLTKRRSKLA